MRAAVARIGRATDYFEGKEIDAAHVGQIPDELIGRLLSPEEAIELTAKLSADDGPAGVSPPWTPSPKVAPGSSENEPPNGETQQATN